MSSEADGRPLDEDGRQTVAVYRSDVSLSIAWGSTEIEAFVEDWHQEFADKAARTVWVDTLWNGSPIDRETGVVVDGGRAILPLPRKVMEGDATTRWEMTAWQHTYFKLINSFESPLRDYDSYVQQAGFFIREQSTG